MGGVLKIWNSLRSAALLLLGLFTLTVGLNAHAQLQYGKYFGTLQMDGRPQTLAVSLDAFLVQVDGPTVYPALNVIVRVNGGGYQTSEYIGYNFYNPTFNYENKILQLNDPKNELTATLQVTQTQTAIVLKGPAAYRPTNAKGRMRLELYTGDAQAPAFASGPNLQPELSGEYSGMCGRDRAKLQIETALAGETNATGNALTGFTITGRLGYTNGPICMDSRGEKFCSLYPYGSGTYSPYTGRLVMRGPRGTLECNAGPDSLQCNVAGYDKSGPCTFKKKSVPASGPRQAPAGFQLTVPPEKMKALPDPNPPGNEEIMAALNGNYYGVLHFENRDVYQLAEMSVVATTSTVNEHIQNQVFVEPTLSLHLGGSWESAPAVSVGYPQRVFWLNTGFAFQMDSNEYFLVIRMWRTGYIRGVAYSKTYGRIGDFEMIKDVRPQLPRNLSFMADPSGSFVGPKEKINVPKNSRTIFIEVATRVDSGGLAGIPLLSRYASPGHMTNFDFSVLDPNTGRIAFLIKEADSERLLFGQPENGDLKVIWPTGPVLGAPMEFYQPYTYVRETKH